MPNKKKGKKKAGVAVVAAPNPDKPVATYTNASKNLDDVSQLLFGLSEDDRLPFSLPFVGPVDLVYQRKSDANGQKVVHGRGLVVTRDVSPGECLFVIPAIISTPVDEVRRRFLELNTGNNKTSEHDYGKELEEITDSVLVEQIQALCVGDGSESTEFKQRILNSFLSQMSSDAVPEMGIDSLLAECIPEFDNQNKTTLDKETIINIIHRNAFGPDYHSYGKIADWWMKNSSNFSTASAYNRLLGVYPLAAMINHSCSPNAVRIFGNLPTTFKSQQIQGKEVMIVHASVAMAKGTEITWSYLPPTTPYNIRQETLKTKYLFSCQCVRCTCEKKAIDGVSLFEEVDDMWKSRLSLAQYDGKALADAIQSLEEAFVSHSINSESQRYLRVGFASLYMEYFNFALSSPSIKNITEESNGEISDLVKLVTQLHFSFVSCNNASTEHLSILHLCYELASLMHTRAVSYFPDSSNKTMSQVRFWTEQLKKAHMIRYGSLGESLESVRHVMKHSRTVLRNRDGWYAVEKQFI